MYPHAANGASAHKQIGDRSFRWQGRGVWRAITKPPTADSGKRTTQGISLASPSILSAWHATNLCAEFGQLFLNPFVAAVDVIDAIHFSITVRDQTSQNEAG